MKLMIERAAVHDDHHERRYQVLEPLRLGRHHPLNYISVSLSASDVHEIRGSPRWARAPRDFAIELHQIQMKVTRPLVSSSGNGVVPASTGYCMTLGKLIC